MHEIACTGLMQVEGPMTPRPSQTPLHLRAREVLKIRDGQGLAVRCLSGALWITQDGDTDDTVLKAGQCFVLDRPGLALVSAPVSAATLVVDAATRAAPCVGSKRPAAEGLRRAA
jgi:hypothetical protein